MYRYKSTDNIVYNTQVQSSLGVIAYETTIKPDAYSNIYKDVTLISGIRFDTEKVNAYSQR